MTNKPLRVTLLYWFRLKTNFIKLKKVSNYPTAVFCIHVLLDHTESQWVKVVYFAGRLVSKMPTMKKVLVTSDTRVVCGSIYLLSNRPHLAIFFSAHLPKETFIHFSAHLSTSQWYGLFMFGNLIHISIVYLGCTNITSDIS